MYNRYVPQPDGSYHRKQMQDNPHPKQEQPYTPPPPPPPPPPAPEYCPPPNMGPSPEAWSLPSFFRQLLPRGVDTADLLILLLLLLIAGDCEEDRNNALLTIALYFIL